MSQHTTYNVAGPSPPQPHNGEGKPPTRSPDQCAPTRSQDQRVSAKSQDQRAPTRAQDQRAPTRSQDQPAPTRSQDQRAPTPKQSGKREKETEKRRGDGAGSDEVARLQREVGDLKILLNKEKAESGKLRWEKGKLKGECKGRDDRIMEMGREIGRMRGIIDKQTQEFRAMEQQQKQTKELLAARTAELSATHTFLSTTDRLSEDEVLTIVRDLNENIYQVAVKLTEEWEGLGTSHGRTMFDSTSRPRVSTLVQLARNRNAMGLTFLLQSRLCSQVIAITSGWGHHPELAVLESVYQRLSTSEGQAISARWRSLTHSHLSRPPPGSALLVEELAHVFDNTGSFSSTRRSSEFVRAVALEGIESIIRLALRSELAFVVEVRSSDMSLIFDSPGTVFDGARMTNEYGAKGAPSPGKRDRIAGTTEVGVGKSVCGGPGESRRLEILSKTKVVLEKDVVEGGK